MGVRFPFFVLMLGVGLLCGVMCAGAWWLSARWARASSRTFMSCYGLVLSPPAGADLGRVRWKLSAARVAVGMDALARSAHARDCTVLAPVAIWPARP